VTSKAGGGTFGPTTAAPLFSDEVIERIMGENMFELMGV
jgi:hypothetical protein